MTKCYLYANFGNLEVRNGQVQKALALKTLLRSMYGTRFVPVNINRRFGNLLHLLTAFSPANLYCVSLGRNGILVFAAAYLTIASLAPKRIRPKLFYFVVGGWLPALASSSALIRRFLRQVDILFVETDGLARELAGFDVRTKVFPNFRSKLYTTPKSRSLGTVRLCFCARIREDKGPLLAAALAENLRANGQPVILDFYGPIDGDFKHRFLELIQSGRAAYKGSYSSEDEAIDIMREYDFVVLPTSYPGECMPGTVVEAFCAGTPVVTSDWRYMHEVVRHGRNGLVVSLQDFPMTACDLLLQVLVQDRYEELSRESLLTAKTEYSKAAALALLDASLQASD